MSQGLDASLFVEVKDNFGWPVNWRWETHSLDWLMWSKRGWENLKFIRYKKIFNCVGGFCNR